MVWPIASMFSGSVARGLSSTTSRPSAGGVLAVRLHVAVGVLAKRHAGFLGFENRAIVHVGEVHDVADGEAGLVLQGAAEHVDGDERPEVPDVSAGVGGQPARVHAHQVVARRRERFLEAGQGVEEAHTAMLNAEC